SARFRARSFSPRSLSTRCARVWSRMLPAHRRWFPNGEWIVLAALAGEIALFSAIAPNFASVANFFEVLRPRVQLVLPALALTAVMMYVGRTRLWGGYKVGVAGGAAGSVVAGCGVPCCGGGDRGVDRGRRGRPHQLCPGGAVYKPAADRDTRIVLTLPRHRG